MMFLMRRILLLEVIIKRLFETISDSHMTLRMDKTIGGKLESAIIVGEYKDIFALRSILENLDRLSDEMKKECPCGNLYFELYFLNPLVESGTKDDFAKYNIYACLKPVSTLTQRRSSTNLFRSVSTTVLGSRSPN